jgi:hypothetical protein
MKHLLTFFLALTITTTSFSQVDQYSEDVKLCLKNNGTYNYYDGVVDQMFTHLKDQYKDLNVPNEVWKELEQIKTGTLDELSQMIVSVYRGHFNHQDLKNMNALYGTTAGKKMVNSQTELNEGDKVVLNEFYKSDTGQKIVGSQDSINASMMQITEMWSADLYKSVIEKLSEKGFSLEK